MHVPPRTAFIDGQPTTFLASFLASDGVFYVGKSVILFTMFYTTLNWWYFKRLSEEYEADIPKKEKKEKDDTS
jgi:hypothetical protein